VLTLAGPASGPAGCDDLRVLDHVGLNVSDYARSRAFFEAALAPLGLSVVMAFDERRAAGFGDAGKPVFWVLEREPQGTGTHVAFAAADRSSVDRFHAAALAAGGLDNGAPGLREHYHPTYYAAFVHDPDGNNIEAVCHAPA
jgi:catechol 2,3-dioxygenase-like lactoylglutathione lyase family enzyme